MVERWARALPLVAMLACGCSRTTNAGPGEACRSDEDGGRGGCKDGLWCFEADGREGRCVTKPEADAGCRKTKGCSEAGLCSYHVGIAGCVPAGPPDCERSEVCQESGKCTFARHGCIVKTDADCKRARVCGEEGLCRAKPDAAAGKCVASTP